MISSVIGLFIAIVMIVWSAVKELLGTDVKGVVKDAVNEAKEIEKILKGENNE